MNVSDRRSLEVALAVTRALDGDAAAVLAKGLDNIARRQRQSGPHAYLQAWEAIIRQGPEAVRAILTGHDKRSRQLRAASPFSETLSEDVRLAAIHSAEGAGSQLSDETAPQDRQARVDGQEEAFRRYWQAPPPDSALARAIAFGIDPTLTFGNMFGMTPAKRLAQADRSISEMQAIARWRAGRRP